MRKTTLLSIVAISWCCLLSCTKSSLQDEETSLNDRNEVRFAEPFVYIATKSATGDITDTKALRNHDIRIWGETYSTDYYGEGDVANAFNGNGTRTLTWNETFGRWTYDNAIFWQDGLNYDFVGLAPADETASTTYNNGKITIGNIPVVQTINNAEDGRMGIDYLLSDVATSKYARTREDIRLNFKHILSRVSLFVWKNSSIYQKITLKDMTLFLPGANAKATYTEASHNGPSQENDSWTWTGHDDMDNASGDEQLTGYSSHDMVDADVEVPACSDAAIAEINAARLPKEFFIAPTPKDGTVTIYAKVTYDMEEEGGAVNEITKFAKLESLGKLKQGYKHNIYICLGEQTVTFSVDNVEGWQYDSETEKTITNSDGHNYGFMAFQNGFDIEGVIKTKKYGDVTFGTATLKKKGGSQESEAEMELDGWYATADCNGTRTEEPTANNCYAKFKATLDLKTLDNSGTYVLTLRDQDDDANTAEVEMALDAMDFTINTSEANAVFCVPFALGETPSPVVIVWGDNSSPTIIETNVTESNRRHTYAAAGTYSIRLITLQNDAGKAQIPDFNFGFYPTRTSHIEGETGLTFTDNANGQMLQSIDSPLLYTGTTDLTAMFYGTGLQSVCSDMLKNYSQATSLEGMFRGCGNLTTVPDGLFDAMTKVTDMRKLFRDCTALTSLPDGLFAKQAKCYKYYQLLLNCNNLKLSDGLFISEADGITKDNRFADVAGMVRIDNMFHMTGSNLTTDAGTLPDLWNYTFPHKYGYYKDGDSTAKFPISYSNSYWTNKDDIPVCWYKTIDVVMPDNFTLTTTLP